MTHDIAQIEDSSAQRRDAALSCIRRGWPIVPLHDVSMGYCSCGDTSDKHTNTSAGKHPLAKAWGPGAISDETIAAGVFSGRPGMNFGIKTGVASRLWALDVDPVHGGDERLRELTKEHGALPDTYSQRTGSGGVHHLFALPDDFTPTNSRGTLPVGLDVRGEGGFIVAAPCRSGIGPYEVLLDLPVVPAPHWLLDMIRPRVPVDVEHRAALAHWDSPLLAGQSDRLVRYGHAAMLAELTLLQNAAPGTRGSTAHRVACNLIELINSPWSGVSEETAKTYFGQAAARAMIYGGGFDEKEAWGAWGSAARKIGARGRAAPETMAGGVLIGWNQLGGVPPFSGAGTTGIPGSETNNGSSPTSWTPWDAGGTKPVQGPNDLVQFIGQSGTQAPGQQDPIDAMIATFFDSSQLAALPPPRWLIKNWIPLEGLVQTVGQPGHGKSFVALDQAMHVALGRDWHGNRVQKAHVVYLIAEGVSGMGQRVKAWEQRFNAGERVTGITFVPYPVQASDAAHWELLMMACRRLGAGYIVVDTQARVTVGMEENSAKEMGVFVHQVERLRAVTGATVNVVHHQNKAGGSARGSSAMLGALHTEITVARSQDRVTSMVTKQKDAEAPESLVLQLVSERLFDQPLDALDGSNPAGWTIGPVAEPVWAGVLVEVDKVDALEWERTDNRGKLLMLLRDIYPLRGATKAEAVAEAKRRGMAKQSAHWAWDQVVGTGLVSRAVVDDRPTDRFVVTPFEDRSPAQEA